METATTLSGRIKSTYDLRLLDRALPNLIFGQFAQERNIPEGGGRSIEFTKYGSLTAATTALTEGVVPTETSLSTSTVTATVSQYGAYVKGTDALIVWAIDPILSEVSGLLGEQAGLTVDTLIRNTLAAGTTVQYAGSVGSRGGVSAANVLSATEVRKALRTLQKANARPITGGDFAMFISPDAHYDLSSDSTYVNASMHARPRDEENPLWTGQVSRFLGFTFIMSSNAPVFTAAGAGSVDVHAAIAVGADAYGVTPLEADVLETYYEPPGSAGALDPLHQIWSYGWKIQHGDVRLQEGWIVRIEHGVTA